MKGLEHFMKKTFSTTTVAEKLRRQGSKRAL